LPEQPTAIVTGGAVGIGHAISCQLTADGYQVVAFSRSPQDQVQQALNDIAQYGLKPGYIQGSIAEKGDRERLLQRVMEVHGHVDLLVNNAGVAPPRRLDLLDTTEENFDFVMDVNLKGTFFLTQAIARVMIAQQQRRQSETEGPGPKQGPKIINISSISAYTSSVNRGEYCISKAGIGMITQLFAHRLAEHGIGVFEIRPGITDTQMTENVREKYDRLIAGGLTPIQRWGLPEDVANAVMVICSGRLSFSTGETINVDGGFHLRRL